MAISVIRPLTQLHDILQVETNGRKFIAQTLSVAQLLEAAANTHPERDGIRFLHSADSNECSRTSLRNLYGGILSTAAFLAEMNVTLQDVVSILLPAIPEAHFSLWGSMTAGIANPMNTLLSRDAIIAQLNSVNAKVLIALGPHSTIDIWKRVRGLEKEVPSLQSIVQVEAGFGFDPDYPVFDHVLSKANPAQFVDQPDPERIAALFHTGGTTGSPRVVQLTHRNLIAAAWSTVQSYNFVPDDIVLCGLPLFHVGGAIDGGLSVLAAGSCIVIPTIGGMRNPEVVRNFWYIVERTGTTIIAMVPTSFAAVVNVPLHGENLSKLSFAICGGASIPSEISRKFEAISKAPVHELFGMTECSGIASCNPRSAERRLGSAGLPIPMMEIAVKTNEGLEDSGRLPTGTGEILIRGPNVFRGYRNSRHNDGVILPDAWVCTGDLGHLDKDGFLWITGRQKDVIIRGGHNIDPQSIENLAAAYPGVALAAAVGQIDDYAGELPILFVVGVPGFQLNREEILAFVADRISEPPAKPRSVVIINEMPLTPLGKIFKPRLRAMAAEKLIDARLATILAPRPVRTSARYDEQGRMTVKLEIRAIAGDDFTALTSLAVEDLCRLPVTVVEVAQL